MRLQNPSSAYNPTRELERNRSIELSDRQNHKRGQDIEVGGNDERLILTDDNGIRYEVYVDTSGALQVAIIGGALVPNDFNVQMAEAEILDTYGDTVSVTAKKKSLHKFGSNETVGTSFETVAQFQGTTANETYVSTNIIDSVVSSSGSDTQTITIEGHTIDGSGNLTFVSQDATLTGQTEVTLTTPLARANRMFIAASGTFDSPQAVAVGVIAAYDNTAGITSGVPNTAAATKCVIIAGDTQSQKCATSISSTDYLIVTDIEAHVGDGGGSAAYVLVRLEKRDVFNGGVWVPVGNDIVVVLDTTSPDSARPLPYLIVPKNHDVRVRAKTNANTADLHAEISGFLAAIQ